MKIAILTFPNSTSLGASLQMYSLYTVLQDMGHHVEILNYSPPNLHSKREKPTQNILEKAKVELKTMLIHIMLPSSEALFKKFESAMKKKPIKPTDSTDDQIMLANEFDRIIVGSDQVWNYDVTGHDFNFYLQFCNDNRKKISYAASFGHDDVCESEKEKIARLLKEFFQISVREEQGQKIIQNLISYKPKVVLDPTLLIDKTKLECVMRPYLKEEKYVLFYNINPSTTLLKMATEFAQNNGLKIVKIGGRVKERFVKTLRTEYGVGPAEFLGLVRNASYVFTNSFHGFAISIALERNVYVEYSTYTNSRLLNMVNMFELEECVVDKQTSKKPPIEIDYAKVNSLLATFKEESKDFLMRAIQE